jgi:hypothetical protein
VEQAAALNGMSEVQFRSAPTSSQEAAVPLVVYFGTSN